MPVCSNLDCYNHVWGSKKRCSQCRFKYLYTCAICGDEITNMKKVFCVSCADLSRLTWAREYQRNHKRLNKETVSN